MFAVFFPPYLDTSCDLGGRWLTYTLDCTQRAAAVMAPLIPLVINFIIQVLPHVKVKK